MQTFIDGIIDFVGSIYLAIRNYFANLGTAPLSAFDDFLSTQILNGSMISSPLTWYQLIRYITPMILIIFFIIFVFKIVYKIIGLFRIWKLY